MAFLADMADPKPRDDLVQSLKADPFHFGRSILLLKKMATSRISKQLTRRDIDAKIEREAREMLGVSSRDAFRMIKAGDLRGTIAETELLGLRSLRSTAR
jgi:hypothetical protein